MSEIDPVCGMLVGEDSKYRSLYKGKVYLFCSASCKREFDRDPESHLAQGPKGMSCC
ncbi:MAG: YHS domain-containing protein [Thermoprotei archaeon]